jgi:hypothetical protein
MRCAEAQELMLQGKSTLYFNAPHCDSLHLFADEVDRHLERCSECGEKVIRLLCKQFWRRPGLRHWYQLRCVIRRERNELAIVAMGRKAEAPIVRVANVIMQEAIKNEASCIDFRPLMAGGITPEPISQPFSDDGSELDKMKSDLAWAACNINYDEPAWSVEFTPAGRVERKIVLPGFVAPNILACYKSMADLLVSVMDQPQTGNIPIRYENRNYTVSVRTILESYGERLSLEIAAA